MIDEFGRLERREADDDVDDAEIDVVLRRRFLVAFDEVGFARRLALERALAEQVVHERADVEPDLRPERFVVRLEHNPLRAAIETFLDEERQCGARERISIRRRAGRRPPSVRAPQTTRPAAGKVRRQLMPSGLSWPFSSSVSVHAQGGARPTESASVPAGCFPDAAIGVGPGAKTPATRRKARNRSSGSRATDR